MRLIAFIVPAPPSTFPRGTHNGCVAVPPEHPMHGEHMDDDACLALRVHGGITLSESVILPAERRGRMVKPEFIGKRIPALDGAEYLTGDKDIPDDWWIFGFDTCHFSDNATNWNRHNVISETLHLKKQLEALAK